MSWDDPRELQPGDLARSAPMLLHDPDEDRVRYVVECSTPWGPHDGPRVELRSHLSEVLAAWSDAVAAAARVLAPVFERARAQLADVARQAEAAGLIDRTPPLDPREAILAAKRAAGRTGPPLARLDGRRARR